MASGGAAARRVLAKVLAVVFGLMLALVGFTSIMLGLNTLSKWSAISIAYAFCGLVWLIAGAAMILSGVLAALTSGQKPLPLWTGAAAGCAAGLTLILGTSSGVIPCASPG